MEQKDNKPNSGTRTVRVLMQNRPNAITQPGGDTIVMQRLEKGLRKLGVDVCVDLEGREDPRRFDLVHLFNFALPDLLRAQAERAHAAGVPFVVTTLAEDIPSFHSQSRAYADWMTAYVQNRQNKEFIETHRPHMDRIAPVSRFLNDWVAQHAAALFTNGISESRIIERDYPEAAPRIAVELGYELGAPADPSLFVREYALEGFVLSVGRFESRKNQLMLLLALENEDIPVVLVSGGFTYQPEYDAAVRQFKRRGRTVILERLSPEMLASAYAAAKVHALPSWFELPGLVSLEAAHAGCNVVACMNGTARDYLGADAYYCDPSNEESIRNAVVAAYYSPHRDQLRGRILGFSWERCCRETLSAYERINATKPKTEARPASIVIPQPAAIQETRAQDFDELLAVGENSASERQFDRAHQYLAQACAIRPDSARALRARGAVYLAEQNANAAQNLFERAIKIDSRDAKSLIGLGMCCLIAKKHAQAHEYFTQGLELLPDHLVAIYQLIECAYVLDKFESLDAVLRRYIASHPNDPEMQFCLAGCLYKQGRYTEAREWLQRVTMRNPQHAGAVDLAKLLVDKVDISKPANSTNAAISAESSEPQQVRYSIVRQRLMEMRDDKRQRKFDQVIQACESYLTQGMATPAEREELMALKAECLACNGELAHAESLYAAILVANPRSAHGLSGKAVLTAHNGDWDGAKKLFAQALESNPRYDVAFAGLGLCEAQIGNREGAFEYYCKALEVNPENTRALLGIVEHAYALKRLPVLEHWLKAYLDMHPGDLEFIYSLAGCYYGQERYGAALEEVERILIFTPNHANALELKGMIHEKIGMSDAAASA